MAPNALSTEVAATLLAIVLAADLSLVWNRVAGRWGRAVRVVAIVLCAASTLAVGGIALNRELNLYVTWSELGGGSDTGNGGDPAPVAADPAGSRIVQFQVDGTSSHLWLSAMAYLPPGYDSAAQARTRYPVIEAFHGFPGSPNSWTRTLNAQKHLDTEIGAGRMAPTVVIFPYEIRNQIHDSECVNAAGGDQFETFLTTDVRATVADKFRVRTDRAGWGTVGLSTGGFCAVNIALRHPDRYAAAASLSGYYTALTDKTTGDLYKGSQRLRDENSPLWRIKNLPIPAMPLFLATAMDDKFGYQQQTDFAAAVKPPLQVTVTLLPLGGHTSKVWEAVEPAAFDWLSGWLGAPEPDAAPVPSHGAVTQSFGPIERPSPSASPSNSGPAGGPANISPSLSPAA